MNKQVKPPGSLVSPGAAQPRSEGQQTLCWHPAELVCSEKGSCPQLPLGISQLGIPESLQGKGQDLSYPTPNHAHPWQAQGRPWQ